MDSVIYLPDHLFIKILKQLNIQELIDIINSTPYELKKGVKAKILEEVKSRNLNILSEQDLGKLILYYEELVPLYKVKFNKRLDPIHENMTLAEIQERLNLFNLSARGTRSELMERLKEALDHYKSLEKN